MIQLLRKHGFDFMLGGSSSQSDIVTPIEAALSSREPTLSPAPSLANLKRDVRSGAVTDWKGFKKLVYATVLATDMSLHFEWIQSFKIFAKGIRDGDMEAEVRAGRFDSEDYRQLRERGRVLLCQAIIKCADISNPVSTTKRMSLVIWLIITYRRPDPSMSRSTGPPSYYKNGPNKQNSKSFSIYPFLRSKVTTTQSKPRVKLASLTSLFSRSLSLRQRPCQVSPPISIRDSFKS